MKTKNFASDAEVAALVEAFETATIPASEFTHAAHIAVALTYLETLPPDQALERMREKIRGYAAHHGVSNLYHETLTTFWIKLLDHVATQPIEPSSRPVDAKRVDLSRRRSPRRPKADPSRRSRLAKADLPLWQRINLIVARWGSRRPVETHYSRELIVSRAARESWVPPDRLPLPF